MTGEFFSGLRALDKKYPKFWDRCGLYPGYRGSSGSLECVVGSWCWRLLGTKI